MAEAKAHISDIRAFAHSEIDRFRLATPDEILTALEVLESRYHRHETDPRLAKILAMEWVDDLEHLTVGQLQRACQGWRKSDNAFAPRSAGQLLPFAGTSYINAKAHLVENLEALETAVPLAILSPDEAAKAKSDHDAKTRAELEAKKLERARIAAEREAKEAADRQARREFMELIGEKRAKRSAFQQMTPEEQKRHLLAGGTS